jgi:hypothetical protein
MLLNPAWMPACAGMTWIRVQFLLSAVCFLLSLTSS